MDTDGVGANEIMRVTGKAKTCVWRWQHRCMEAGPDGLLVDKTPSLRIPPLGDAVTKRVVALTLTEPPGEVAHWAAAAIAALARLASGYQPVHAAPPPSGVHPLSQHR